MDLSASAVERKTFDTIRRDGFDPEQVSAFLAEVAEELAEVRGELARERSRSRTLELNLTEAKSSMQRETDSFLAISDTKHRVMEAAERRVLGMLALAHAKEGSENAEDLARVDLRAILEETGAGASVLGPDEAIAVPTVLAADESSPLDEEPQETSPVPQATGGVFGVGIGEVDGETERALAGAQLLLAAASRVPTREESAARVLVAEARDEAERVRLNAKLIHARAEVLAKNLLAEAEREADRLETTAAETAADKHHRAQVELSGALDEVEAIKSAADGEAAEVVAAAEAEAARTVAEAARLMEEARDLPERFSTEAEEVVAQARQQADEIRDAAGRETEQAQQVADAVLVEAQDEADRVRQAAQASVVAAEERSAEARYQADAQAMEIRDAARAEVVGAEAEVGEIRRAAHESVAAAEREAESALAAAQEKVEALVAEIAELETNRDRVAGQTIEDARREADETRERALEEVEVVEAEISELLATARADAEAMRSAASEEGSGVLDEARAEGRRVIDEARIEAELALRGARSEHQELVGRLRSMKLIIEELQQRLPDLAMGEGAQSDVVVLLDEAGAAAIDLRHRLDGFSDDVDADEPPLRASRYSKRSAGLPSMGREEAGKALDGIATLRAVEPQKSSRRRGGKNKGHHTDPANSDEETA